MKLVIATPLYPPEPGGPATYVKLLEEGLPLRGIEVTVVKFSDVRRFPKVFRHMMYQGKVTKALKDADAVLALDPASVGYPVMLAAKKAKKPFFVKVVGDYAWEQGTQRFGVTLPLDEFVKTNDIPFPVSMLRKMQTLVAREAKRVIVPSDYLKDIVTAWGISTENIDVINNAIEIPDVLPTIPRTSTEFLVVSVGRDVPWKGFDAIRRIGARHIEDGWRVEIISDKTRDEALGWMKAADVFVLNSRYEGFPHTLVEAMTIGTPVIAADNRGNAALIEKGKTGLLVPQDDDDALERALLNVRGHRADAMMRASIARERAEVYTVPRMLDATAAFLKTHV